jgi:hypothetical protein
VRDLAPAELITLIAEHEEREAMEAERPATSWRLPLGRRLGELSASVLPTRRAAGGPLPQVVRARSLRKPRTFGPRPIRRECHARTCRPDAQRRLVESVPAHPTSTPGSPEEDKRPGWRWPDRSVEKTRGHTRHAWRASPGRGTATNPLPTPLLSLPSTPGDVC